VSERRLRIASVLVATAGAAVAAYLLAVRAGGAELVCRTGGCETVQSSKYAEVLGIPVAALGLAGFLAIGVLSLLSTPLAQAAAASLALGALVFSAYLLVVQLVVIGEVCDWCLVNDALVTALAALVLVRTAVAASATTASRGTIRSHGRPA
jgi:uncharacterized membrane protein